MPIAVHQFGTTPSGQSVSRFVLAHPSGLTVELTDYGARLTAVRCPDRAGRPGDVVLGHDALEPYLDDAAFLGCTVGRFANRIGGASFELDGERYAIKAGPGQPALHGGLDGFDKRVWLAQPEEAGDALAVTFSLISEDGDQGFPGRLEAKVRFTLTAGALSMGYEATTDHATPVSLTNHAYWHLADAGRTSVAGHRVRLDADRYLPVDGQSIPTGELASVAGTVMDLRDLTELAGPLNQPAGGYDHCFVVHDAPSAELRTIAEVVAPASGRRMAVQSTQPGVQLYTGNFLDGSIVGRGGVTYQRHAGLCLETQAFPDAPNQPTFPSCVLRPGEVYRHQTVHQFFADA